MKKIKLIAIVIISLFWIACDTGHETVDIGDPSTWEGCSTIEATLKVYAQADYANYGHIKYVYQLTPNTLKSSENLDAINSNETNVMYCWTGQTSASVSAYLTVLGYDVKSLKFGANSTSYDELTSSKWPKPYSC